MRWDNFKRKWSQSFNDHLCTLLFNFTLLGELMGHVDVEIDGAGQEMLEVLAEVVFGDEGYLGLAQNLGHVFGHQDHEGIGCIFFLELGHQVSSYG